MSRWANDATEPTPAELDRLLDGDPALTSVLREATEPSPAEVGALLRRELTPRARWSPAPALALAGAALALIAGLVWMAAGPTVPTNRPDAEIADVRPPPGPEVPVVQDPWSIAGDGAHTVHRDADGPWVEHRAGTLTYTVAPIPAGQVFRVRAGAVQVRVIGTAFTVSRAGEHVEVAVHEGLVEVTSPAGARILRPTERWPASDPVPVPVPDPTPAAAPDPSPVPAPTAHTPTRTARYAALLTRADAGERSLDLADALESFAAEADDPLSRPARVLAVQVADRPAADLLARLEALLADPTDFPGRAGLTLRAADLQREAGRCALAVPRYRALTADRAHQAAARAGLALCDEDSTNR